MKVAKRRVLKTLGGKTVVLFVLVLLLISCQKKMPDSVIGTWATDDQRHKGCSLVITADRISFVGADRAVVDDGMIRKVSVSEKGSLVLMKADYVNAQNASFATEIIYSPQEGGSLRLKNQPGITWKRSEEH